MGNLSSASNLENCGTKPPERRQSPRIRCQLPIEIRTKGSRFATRGETTDVSITGCYVASMQPMAIGTEIEFRCWVGAHQIECKAITRTCDPCVGNGIEFLDLDALSKSILGYHLQKQQADIDPGDEQLGIIRAGL